MRERSRWRVSFFANLILLPSIEALVTAGASSSWIGAWSDAADDLRTPNCRAALVDLRTPCGDALAPFRAQWVCPDSGLPFHTCDVRRRIRSPRDLKQVCALLGKDPTTTSSLDETSAALEALVDGFSSLRPNDRSDIVLRIITEQSYETAKCPQWHVDNVPLRGLVTILGDATEYLPTAQFAAMAKVERETPLAALQRSVLGSNGSILGRVPSTATSELEDDESEIGEEEWSAEDISTAPPQHVLLLKGKKWESKQEQQPESTGSSGFPAGLPSLPRLPLGFPNAVFGYGAEESAACFHRSPKARDRRDGGEEAPPPQGRILLSLDYASSGIESEWARFACVADSDCGCDAV